MLKLEKSNKLIKLNKLYSKYEIVSFQHWINWENNVNILNIVNILDILNIVDIKLSSSNIVFFHQDNPALDEGFNMAHFLIYSLRRGILLLRQWFCL